MSAGRLSALRITVQDDEDKDGCERETMTGQLAGAERTHGDGRSNDGNDGNPTGHLKPHVCEGEAQPSILWAVTIHI